MGTLELQEIYFIFEIAAAVAVIVSLLYVGAQVKENTRAVRLSSAYAVSEALREQYALVASHADLAEIWLRGIKDIDDLKGADVTRFYALMHNLFRAVENAYEHRRQGELDERFFDGLISQTLVLMHMPGFNRYWESRKFTYGEDFQVFMTARIAAIEIDPGFRFAGT